MPHISLTQLGAERLRAADIYWDKNLPGFGLRVSPKGRKTFFVQYRFRPADGSLKERQETLGTLDYLSAAEARNRARASKAKAASGIDPVGEKRAARAAVEVERKATEFTLKKLVERYQKEHVLRNQKPSGAQQKSFLLGQWLRAMGERPANAITEEDVLKFKIDCLEGRKNGLVQVDQLIGVLRHMYAW